ncbi:hypothetical protein Tdes44962_MAKER04605 [Teratosphaeria destructans]|uniref:BTB domain-containing protein n=1 Tax=Teratosphaeria destructans TaxID=418781 RepID=A0A9W7SM84_9PEZI|nr:hypothetical protein Tdes44962_MAKER04605 [Teratosphaeria destructans]
MQRVLSYQVKVNVGTSDGQKTLEATKGILCLYSRYFESALDGKFLEPQAGTALSAESPATLSLNQRGSGYVRRGCHPINLTPDLLANFWIFGDAYVAPLLQNPSLTACEFTWPEYELPFSLDQVSSIYWKTTRGPPLVANTAAWDAATTIQIERLWATKKL